MELICSVQKYHWGNKGTDSLVGKFAKANSKIHLNSNENYAEFWMGTHTNGPSFFKTTNMKLSDYLNLHPEKLGLEVIEIFGNQLPFLLKILSVRLPLSIQAHPSKSHAEELFNSFPSIYKDKNHKPEIAIAVTKFEALCGFRTKSEIKQFLEEIEEFRLLIDSDKLEKFWQADEKSKDSDILLKDCFKCLMFNKEEIIAEAVEKLINRLEKLPLQKKEKYLYELVQRVHASFPKDIGIFCIYLLNYIVLSPGQALYLAPNEPHAYLRGNCVECMANSDNVVRAGLTPKFRDVQTLCSMLTYKSFEPNEILFCPFFEDEYCKLYSPPIKDFAVANIVLPDGCNYFLRKRKSASILLVLEGHGESDAAVLEFGKVLFIPAQSELQIKSHGISMFQAFCNL